MAAAMADRTLVEQTLEKLIAFLHNYLPLANAHVADFLIEDYWHRFVPEPIRRDLLALSERDLALLPSCALYTGLELPLRSTGSEESGAQGAPMGDAAVAGAGGRGLWDRSRLPRWDCEDLRTFVLEAQHLTLPQLGVLTDVDELRTKWQQEERSRTTIRHFMSEKKRHEVEVMAEVCAMLASSQHIDTVVDIGSGRGYLSSHLCLMHGLSVLAVDSSSINTGSARVRSQRLEKYWPGLIRNANKAESSNISPTQPPTGVLTGERKLTEVPTTTKNQHQCIQVTQFVTPETDLRMLVRKHLACHKDLTALGGDAAVVPFDFTSTTKDSALVTEEATSHRHSVTAGVLSLESITEGMKSQDSATEEVKSIESLTEEVNSLDSITEKVVLRHPNVTEGVKSLESDPEGVTSLSSGTEGMTSLPVDTVQMRSERLMLTGLHTCGNLAASMLEMFCVDSAAGALCNVGCCYHQLDEVFCRSPFEGDESPAHLAFPMSKMLLSRGVQLGRNARMLASQTPARMASVGKVSHRSLFYRALLQTLLRDLTGQVSDDWHVGKIFAKSKDFPDYVRRALKKLRVDDHDQVTHDMVTEYEKRHSLDESRLTAFVQLRATLAPVIEATILLDRLLYLHEQEKVAESYLVQLFDTVTSPRCYGVLAVRP